MFGKQTFDVSDMAIIYRTFHSGCVESARLVRADSAPCPGRVTFLADHIDFGIAMLRAHHEVEDEMVYPKLIERIPERAPAAEDVEHDHWLIKAALDAVSATCAVWRTRPSAATCDPLAVALDQLDAVAQRHLDDDEQREIVPLAAMTLTQQEWNAIGRHGVAQIPRNKRAVVFGMITDPLDDVDRSLMKRVLSAPDRMLYPFLIDLPWKRYMATLRTGTRPATRRQPYRAPAVVRADSRAR